MFEKNNEPSCRLNFLSVDSLLNSLDALFPKRPPALSDTDREVWFKAGQRSIVDLLIMSKEKSDKEEGIQYV